jgi:hypothetical protein
MREIVPDLGTMWAMLFSVLMAAAVAATPCQPGISLRAPARIEDRPATCVQYASVPLEHNSTLIVYAIQALAKRDDDFAHRVFVALIDSRKGRSTVLARREITSSIMNTGEPGYFYSMQVVANRFSLAGERLVDLAVGSTISGSGGISSASDLIFGVHGKSLGLRARFEDTEGGARGGISYMAETTSELLVGSDELVLVRKRRIARRRVADEPFVVNCDVTRTAYTITQTGSQQSRQITESELQHLRKESQPLARIEHRENLPCCKGCRFNE